MTPESFSNEKLQGLAEIVYEAFNGDENISPAVLIDRIEDEKLRTYIYQSAFQKYTISKTWEEISSGLETDKNLFKYAKDAVKSFKLFKIDKEIEQNDLRLKDTIPEEELRNILTKHNNLLREKKLIQEE